MKIIELFNNQKVEEGPVVDFAKDVGKGASEFIRGASGGEVDIAGTLGKYIKNKETGTTRSVGSNLPPKEQFENLLNNVYGKENVTPELMDDWKAAIQSNNKDQVKQAKMNHKRLEKPDQQDPTTGNWKSSNKDIVAYLMKSRDEF